MDFNRLFIVESKPSPVVDALQNLLSHSTAVRDRAQGFHWNVVGPLFPMLHDLFDEQYRDLADAIDQIAERLRQLGVFVDPRLGNEDYEAAGHDHAMLMVGVLANDNEALADTADACAAAGESAGDSATVDLAGKRASVHRKAAWMLRSIQGSAQG